MRIKSLPLMLFSSGLFAGCSPVPATAPTKYATNYNAGTAIHRKMVAAFQIALLLILTLWIRPVLAFVPPNVSTLEMAQDSDIVLVGTMRNLRGVNAQFVVEQVLKGAGIAPVVEVTPVASDLPTMGARRFQEGETLVLFLKRGAVLTIMVNGWGALTFTPETKTATVEAVKHLLQLPPRSDKDAMARAMLSLAVSDNFLLRGEAHRYIGSHLNHNDARQKYQKELVELLKHPAADVRGAALQGLRFVQAAEALPLIIEISRGTDMHLADSASMALAPYETPESVAALIALTRHANPDLRVRALIDLDDSPRPEAKVALVALLDDPDPKVRALAPRGLVMWLRRGEAKEVLPKIVKMLDDPVDEVRVRAAQELGESRDADVIPALLDVLRRPNLSEGLEGRTVQSLSMIYSHLTINKQIEDNLPLLIAALDRGRWIAGLNALSILSRNKTPEAIAALRRAAAGHPNADIRKFALDALARP